MPKFPTMAEEDRSWAELTEKYRRTAFHAYHAPGQFVQTCSICCREALASNQEKE